MWREVVGVVRSETDKGLPTLPKEWELQRRLRCASVCGMPLPPRVVKGLLGCDGATMFDLYLHLRGWRRDAPLADVVRTRFEYEQVTRAYVMLYNILATPRRKGRAASRKLAWIVPDAHLRNTRSKRALVQGRPLQVSDAVQRSVGLDRDEGAEMLEWLPWMSLGVATRLRGWRSPRINMLRRAMFKLAGDMDGDAAAFYPWEAAFGADTRLVPLMALYQYEPCPLMRDSVAVLRGLGLSTVDDLRCLHPAAVANAKTEGQPLLVLYRSLRRHTASGDG